MTTAAGQGRFEQLLQSLAETSLFQEVFQTPSGQAKLRCISV